MEDKDAACGRREALSALRKLLLRFPCDLVASFHRENTGSYFHPSEDLRELRHQNRTSQVEAFLFRLGVLLLRAPDQLIEIVGAQPHVPMHGLLQCLP